MTLKQYLSRKRVKVSTFYCIMTESEKESIRAFKSNYGPRFMDMRTLKFIKDRYGISWNDLHTVIWFNETDLYIGGM